MRLPTLQTTYVVSRKVLRDTRTLLMPSARKQLEGVVVWWGQMLDGDRAEIETAFRPRQLARRAVWGLSVEVPRDAITEMIAMLPSGMSVLARLHTHGTEAYHSGTDDENMLIAHQGAISIVIRFFAREPIDLSRCSVNMLDHARGWVELGSDEVARRFEVLDD
jgi:hypothetical protein